MKYAHKMVRCGMWIDCHFSFTPSHARGWEESYETVVFLAYTRDPPA